VPLSNEARKKLQSSIEDFYKSFIDRVAQGRKRSPAQIEPVAQGRVWLGDQAKANGLVDQLGGLDQAIGLVKQKAGIPGADKVRLVAYPPRRSIFEQLFTRQAEAAMPQAELFSLLRRFSTRTWIQGGMLKMMPYTIEMK
jgi:protease-4